MAIEHNIRIDRNLTIKRLPIDLQEEQMIMLIVFDICHHNDHDDIAKSVMDIIQGSPKEIIKFFNSNREWYAYNANECILKKSTH